MGPLTPFAFDFMQRAFAVTAIVAVPMALLSCLLILRGWSLMGDAISHAVLPGIVVAYWFGAPLAVGAFGIAALPLGVLADHIDLRWTLSGMGVGVIAVVTSYALAGRRRTALLRR